MTTTDTTHPAKCRYCGMHHGPTCWMIKAIEYHSDGSVKRVEFKTALDYPPYMTVFDTTPFFHTTNLPPPGIDRFRGQS